MSCFGRKIVAFFFIIMCLFLSYFLQSINKRDKQSMFFILQVKIIYLSISFLCFFEYKEMNFHILYDLKNLLNFREFR